MKELALVGQVLGFVSSLLLAWGYSPPKGMMAWAAGDGSEYKKNAKRLEWITRVGFVMLAASFAIGVAVTLLSN